jgi:hypothetical protein
MSATPQRRNSINTTALHLKLPLSSGSGSSSKAAPGDPLPPTPPTSKGSSTSDRMQLSPPGSPQTASSASSTHSARSQGSGGGGSNSNRGSHSVRVRLGSARTDSASPVRAASARDSATATEARPACPHCGRADATHRFGFWLKKSGWVWLCSAEPRDTSSGQGSGFCGHLFYEDKPRADCQWCGVRLQVERRVGTFGYYCSNCTTWSA